MFFTWIDFQISYWCSEKLICVWNYLCFAFGICVLTWNLRLRNLYFVKKQICFCKKTNLHISKHKFTPKKVRFHKRKFDTENTNLLYEKQICVFVDWFVDFIFVIWKTNLCFKKQICVLKNKFMFHMNWFSGFIVVFWKGNSCPVPEWPIRG